MSHDSEQHPRLLRLLALGFSTPGGSEPEWQGQSQPANPANSKHQEMAQPMQDVRRSPFAPSRCRAVGRGPGYIEASKTPRWRLQSAPFVGAVHRAQKGATVRAVLRWREVLY